MRIGLIMRQHAARITFFTRPQCSLCTTARDVVKAVGKTRPFEFRSIDVMQDGQKQWKDMYEFDTPVIHVEHSNSAEDSNPSNAQKLMHRFSEAEVNALLDKIDVKATA